VAEATTHKHWRFARARVPSKVAAPSVAILLLLFIS
jgi:hypothetical protein